MTCNSKIVPVGHGHSPHLRVGGHRQITCCTMRRVAEASQQMSGDFQCHDVVAKYLPKMQSSVACTAVQAAQMWESHMIDTGFYAIGFTTKDSEVIVGLLFFRRKKTLNQSSIRTLQHLLAGHLIFWFARLNVLHHFWGGKEQAATRGVVMPMLKPAESVEIPE